MGINLKNTRASLEQVPQDLECLLTEGDFPVSGAGTAASHAKESQVLPELANLPVDCLKVSNEENVRIETLRNMVFKMLYQSITYQLSGLNEFLA